MAKVSAKGGFHLLWGLVISTVIQSLGTIAIAYFLGEANMGIYYVAVAAPNLIANFRDWGVTTAMVRYSAQYNQQINPDKIRAIFVSGLAFQLIVGLLLSVLSIALSGFLADIYNRPQIAQLIQVTSLFILTGGLVNTATAAFTGLERMHLNSVMLVIQSIVKTALIIGLVLLGLGTMGAVIGFSVAVLVAGITGILLMYTMYRSLPKPTDGQLAILSTIKTMLKYGLPLSIGTIVTGFLTTFYSNILAIFVTDNSLIGNYSVAVSFVVLISFVATPVTTMLLPAFSKLDFNKDKELLKNVFQYSVKYAALLVVPVTFIVMSLAQPAIATIFQNSYAEAPLYLALSGAVYLFSIFGSLSYGNLINSQGDTKFTLKLSLLHAAIGFPLSFVLISQFGVIGLIATTTIVGVPGLVWALHFMNKRYGVSVDWVSSAKIFASSAISAVVTYLFVSSVSLSAPVELVLGAVLFVLVFLVAALSTRTITRVDIINVRQIVSGLGPLRKPLDALLSLLEKFMPKHKMKDAPQS